MAKYSDSDTKATQKVCQSCLMPLADGSACGTNADGSRNADYCHHCYQNGGFTADLTVGQMVERCLPFIAHRIPDQDKARAFLSERLPTLTRWRGQ
jgi:hypothetical protein